MKTILMTLTLTLAATAANGQFSCTPKVSSDICKAAESGNYVAGAVQKSLTVVVADPVSFALEKSQLEAAGMVRCEAARKTEIPKVMNRCSGQAALGISNAVLLETSPDGSLQKIVVSTDFFRAADTTKTKMAKQPDGNSKVEMAYAEPDPLTAFENMTRVGFFVLGFNSGRLNYLADNL